MFETLNIDNFVERFFWKILQDSRSLSFFFFYNECTVIEILLYYINLGMLEPLNN